MEHQLISATYQLFVDENGSQKLLEQTPEGQPMVIYTGLGMTIPAFEQKLAGMAAESDFEFDLDQNDAFGAYEEGKIVDISKDVFTLNGHFDHDHVHEGAVLPLSNENGQRFLGKVVSLSETHVKVDLNHPLAGKDLHFKGHVLENRPASEEEVEQFIAQSKQHHCGGGCNGGCGGCGSEGGSCGSEGEGCGCGNCGGDEGGCEGGCGHCAN